MAGSEKPVGLSASAGWQVGVRRTLPLTREQAWELLTEPEGVKLWLGDAIALPLEPKAKYTTAEGACGEMRVVKRFEQLRLTWQPPGWERPSTVQIRFLPIGPNKTTISFHQENMAGPREREEMKVRWEAVLAAVQQRCGG